MRMQVKLDVTGARPLRNGSVFWWQTILDLTRDENEFSYQQLDGASDPYHEKYLGQFLRKLETAGFIKRASTDNSRVFSLVVRQSNCPIITATGKEVLIGKRLQNMWNVIRKSRGGFTVEELALDASTEGAVVARNTAKQYCLMLQRAGILVVQKAGKRGESRNIYVLKGSANTGPKPPRRMKATLVFDPNRNAVLGDVTAEEDRT